MTEQTAYAVIVVRAYRDELEALAELPPVPTLEEAKQASSDRGYRVMDEGTGGHCETTDAFDPGLRPVHVVSVA